MKRKIAILMALLAVFAVGSAVAAADWVELGKDDENQTWSIDRDSVQTKSYSSIVSVWVKTEYSTILPNGSYSALPPIADYSLLLLEFDFSDRTYRQLAKHDYGGFSDGQIDTTPSGWEYIVPNTIAENIYSTLKGWLNR